MRRRGALAALVALSSLSACAGRQPSQPTVAQVQSKFTDAIGGASAITRPRSMTIRGQNVLYQLGRRRMRVNVLIFAADFKRLEIDSVEGRGRFVSGYDGKTGWTISPGSKPQIVTGANAVSIRRDADLYYWAHIPRYFRAMTVVGIEPFAGRACYRLRGTTLWGNENNQYYEVGSGLLRGYRFHQWIAGTPEKAESVQVFDQYRAFQGLSFPTREQDFRDGRPVGVGRIYSVEFDNVDGRVFIPPAAVRAEADKFRH
jgi:hypothetical protein